MRTIKFRGLRTDGEGWVYGSLLQSEITANGNCNCSIVGRFANDNNLEHIEVIPETVGQFTGLTDKNGVEIYEGDIVKWLFQSGDFAPSFEASVVEYQEYADGWIGFEVFNKAEVIGNIHQN